MKFIRRKNQSIEEAWYSNNPNVNLSKDTIQIKNYLIDILNNELLNKPIEVDITPEVSYKFYEYIGGQLIEARIGNILGLAHVKNINLSDTSLDGRFIHIFPNKNLNIECLVEVKVFKDKLSSIKKLFTINERKILQENANSFVIICKYDLIKNMYTVKNFYIWASSELKAILKN